MCKYVLNINHNNTVLCNYNSGIWGMNMFNYKLEFFPIVQIISFSIDYAFLVLILFYSHQDKSLITGLLVITCITSYS